MKIKTQALLIVVSLVTVSALCNAVMPSDNSDPIAKPHSTVNDKGYEINKITQAPKWNGHTAPAKVVNPTASSCRLAVTELTNRASSVAQVSYSYLGGLHTSAELTKDKAYVEEYTKEQLGEDALNTLASLNGMSRAGLTYCVSNYSGY